MNPIDDLSPDEAELWRSAFACAWMAPDLDRSENGSHEAFSNGMAWAVVRAYRALSTPAVVAAPKRQSVQALLVRASTMTAQLATLAALSQLLSEAAEADAAGRPWLSGGQLRALQAYVAAFSDFRVAHAQALTAFALVG